MKSLVGALALSGLCLLPASAQDDCCPQGPPAPLAVTEFEIQDEDDDKVFGEVEVLLNQVLLVDETGRIVMRKEFRNSLPIPAERVEGMLGQFVELADDGKLHIKDREAVRPYLPMIRGFLGNGLNRLQELQKLPPEERKEAMQRLFGNRGGAPQAEPEPEPRAEAPKAKKAPKVKKPEREDRRMARRERDDEDRPRARRRGEGRRGADRDRGPRGSVEQRLARIERSLARIEDMLESHGRTSRPRARGGFLRRLFGERGERGGRRGRGAREDRRDDMGSFMDRGRTWRNGLRRLFELMEPEDLNALRDGLGAMAKGGFDGDMMRDPGKLMGRLQESLSPEDLARFMEVFSQFMATPEGRAFADEMEETAGRMEEFMNSNRGKQMGEMLEQLRGGGLGDMGNMGELRERVEKMLGRGRDRRAKPRSEHSNEEKRSARRRHSDDAPANPPSGSKLY